MTTEARRDTVAVIGAAAGIGAATARRLAVDGYRVITVDGRDADVICDLGTDAGRRDAIARVTRLAHGVLDGLVQDPRAAPGGQGLRSGADDLERFRATVEAVAARIVFLLGPEARAFWRSVFDDGPPPALVRGSAPAGTVVDTLSGGRR